MKRTVMCLGLVGALSVGGCSVIPALAGAGRPSSTQGATAPETPGAAVPVDASTPVGPASAVPTVMPDSTEDPAAGGSDDSTSEEHIEGVPAGQFGQTVVTDTGLTITAAPLTDYRPDDPDAASSTFPRSVTELGKPVTAMRFTITNTSGAPRDTKGTRFVFVRNHHRPGDVLQSEKEYAPEDFDGTKLRPGGIFQVTFYLPGDSRALWVAGYGFRATAESEFEPRAIFHSPLDSSSGMTEMRARGSMKEQIEGEQGIPAF